MPSSRRSFQSRVRTWVSYTGRQILCHLSHTLVVKNLPVNPGDIRDEGSVPGLGRFPGGGHGNPPQYSYLENSKDRGVWHTTVHRVAKSWTLLKQLSMHT